MASLPSVSQVGNHQSTDARSCVPPTPTPPPIPSPPQPAPHVPHAQPSGPCAPPHRCQGCQELMFVVRRLTFQLQALQTERMVIAASRPSTVPPAQVPAPPSAPSPIGAHPTTGAPGSFPHPPPTHLFVLALAVVAFLSSPHHRVL